MKVVWAPEGSTLFYWSDEKELPVQMLGGLHTSICAERGIETTQKVGFIDAWVPIEKTKGKAKLHFTAQVEWQYDPDYVRTVMKNNLISSNLATSLKAKAGITKVFTGGGQGGMAQRLSRDEQILGQAAFLSLAGSATMEPMYFVTVIEARDVGLHGTSWTCSIMNTENEVLGKTGAASGPNPAWDAEFDISYEAIRVPNVKLVVHKVSEGIRLRPHIENPLSRLACVSADADAEDAGGAIYEGSIRMVWYRKYSMSDTLTCTCPAVALCASCFTLRLSCRRVMSPTRADRTDARDMPVLDAVSSTGALRCASHGPCRNTTNKNTRAFSFTRFFSHRRSWSGIVQRRFGCRSFTSMR